MFPAVFLQPTSTSLFQFELGKLKVPIRPLSNGIHKKAHRPLWGELRREATRRPVTSRFSNAPPKTSTCPCEIHAVEHRFPLSPSPTSFGCQRINGHSCSPSRQVFLALGEPSLVPGCVCLSLMNGSLSLMGAGWPAQSLGTYVSHASDPVLPCPRMPCPCRRPDLGARRRTPSRSARRGWMSKLSGLCSGAACPAAS